MYVCILYIYISIQIVRSHIQKLIITTYGEELSKQCKEAYILLKCNTSTFKYFALSTLGRNAEPLPSSFIKKTHNENQMLKLTITLLYTLGEKDKGEKKISKLSKLIIFTSYQK